VTGQEPAPHYPLRTQGRRNARASRVPKSRDSVPDALHQAQGAPGREGEGAAPRPVQTKLTDRSVTKASLTANIVTPGTGRPLCAGAHRAGSGRVAGGTGGSLLSVQLAPVPHARCTLNSWRSETTQHPGFDSHVPAVGVNGQRECGPGVSDSVSQCPPPATRLMKSAYSLRTGKVTQKDLRMRLRAIFSYFASQKD